MRKFDNGVDKAKMDRSIEARDWSAFNSSLGTLFFLAIAIGAHYFSYPGKINYALYATPVFGIFAPWTLSCVRKYFVIPNTPDARLFCIVYDVIVSKPFFRNHLILMYFSTNGVFDSGYLTLMLLDIINISPVLANILKSISGAIPHLSWVLYLFIITCVIYAQFGLEYFGAFDYLDDDESPGCDSVVACAVLIFYKGIPNGAFDSVLNGVSNQDGSLYTRRLF